MPKIDRVRGKAKKKLLTPEQIAMVIAAAKADPERGVYIATLFLTGMRIGEMLGLQWRDIDFERNEIHVRRVQESDGKTFDATKTDAGMRTIPMGPTLRDMFLNWRENCPRLDGELVRVFPTRGKRQPWPKARQGGGGPLLYSNYRTQVWKPFLAKLALPEVTPHSARHSYISTLQAAGIEVGLVSKLAGHSNPAVTLGIYTQAMRGVMLRRRRWRGSTDKHKDSRLVRSPEDGYSISSAKQHVLGGRSVWIGLRTFTNIYFITPI